MYAGGSIFARLCGDIIPETILEQIHRMMRAAISLQNPMGISLPWETVMIMNPQGIYALAAYLFMILCINGGFGRSLASIIYGYRGRMVITDINRYPLRNRSGQLFSYMTVDILF